MSSSEPMPEMRPAPAARRPVPRPPAVTLRFARVPEQRSAEPTVVVAPVPSPATVAKKKRPKRTPTAAERLACRRKVRYRDAIQAKLILSQTGGGRRTRRGKDEKRAYSCDVCNGWHLTSREAWQPRRSGSGQKAIQGASRG